MIFGNESSESLNQLRAAKKRRRNAFDRKKKNNYNFSYAKWKFKKRKFQQYPKYRNNLDFHRKFITTVSKKSTLISILKTTFQKYFYLNRISHSLSITWMKIQFWGFLKHGWSKKIMSIYGVLNLIKMCCLDMTDNR